MGPSKDPKADFKQEDVLQAVLIADGFSSSSSSFGPLTLDTPHTLLPLVDAPLLDYTLQLLVTSGVRDIFVVSAAFSSRVKSYVDSASIVATAVTKTHAVGGGSAECRVTHVVADGATSVGDALREIDKTGLVKNDFILVTGDVVSNANLNSLVRQHKERKALDKQMAMTVVFRRGVEGVHRSCSPKDEVFIACEAETQKILHFQRSHGTKRLDVPVAVFQEFDDVELRSDLVDPGIAICSPIVPQIFSDDFDYLTRDDFIKGLLVHQEIMGNSLYIGTIDDAYAARAFDLSTYNAISHDVLARWTFPLTPDLFPHTQSTLKDSAKCRYGNGCVYRSSDVVLGKSSRLESNVFVGTGSKIGANSIVKNSFLGKRCIIGQDVVLDGVFLYHDVVIGDRCRLAQSVLAADVRLGEGVTLKPGCVLGPNVKVGDGIVLDSGTELTTSEEFNDDDDDDDEQEDLLGENGFGYRYQREESDDEDDADQDDDDDDGKKYDDEIKKLVEDFWWKTTLKKSDDDDDDDESSDDDDHLDVGDANADDGYVDDEDDEGEDEEMKDLKQFHQEVVDTLLRGVEENVSSDNLVLEINSLKQAYFIYISEVQQCVVKCILEAPIKRLGLAGKPLLLHVKKYGFPLLKNYIKDADAQRLALVALADLCVNGGGGGEAEVMKSTVTGVLTPFLGLLYNEDIIADSDVVFEWFAEQTNLVKKLFAPFAKNLQEAEEEEEEEEDDDDDDDDD